MTNNHEPQPNRIWRMGSKFALYTEDASLVGRIRGWEAYGSEIREMGTYRMGIGALFARQLVFNKRLLSRVEKAAGVKADAD